MKFHISEDGMARPCGAEEGKCPLGGKHYKTAEIARSAYEREQEGIITPKYAPSMEKDLQIATQDLKNLLNTAHTEQQRQIIDTAIQQIGTLQTPADISHMKTMYAEQNKEARIAGEKDTASAYGSVKELLEHSLEREQLRYGNWLRNAQKIRAMELYLNGEKEDSQQLGNKEHLQRLKSFIKDIQEYDDSVQTLTTSKNVKLEPHNPNSKPGYRTGAQQIILVHDNQTLRKLTETSSVIVGRLSSPGNMRLKAAKMQVERDGQKLAKSITETVESSDINKDGLPAPLTRSDYGQTDRSGEFVMLGAGEENNVYLHKDSGMVYKIPHSESPSHGKKIALATEHALSKVDQKQLQKSGTRYVSTFFTDAKTTAGTDVGIIAQPYLDPNTYIPYNPGTTAEKNELARAGVSDLHDGNMVMHKETGEVVLFDCVYAQASRVAAKI